MSYFRCDSMWFKGNRGLPLEGLRVKKIGEDKLSFQEICHYFGPMKNKNGFLYKDFYDVEMIAEIKDL